MSTNTLNQSIEKQQPWQWLSGYQKERLLDLHPQAEQIVDEVLGLTDVTEDAYHAYQPLGMTRERQGSKRPHLHPLAEVMREMVTHYCEIRHPSDPSFTKNEPRLCISVLQPRTYNGSWWDRIALELLKRRHPGLAELRWNIYGEPSGSALIFLRCTNAGAAPHNSLYVPYDVFRYPEWSRVEAAHRRLAVGYYEGSGFRVSPEQVKVWRDATEGLLSSPEALRLKEILAELAVASGVGEASKNAATEEQA